MRKNIFEIMQKNLNLENEYQRINALVCTKPMYTISFSTFYGDQELSLKDYFNKYCLVKWNQRNNNIDYNNIIEILDLKKEITTWKFNDYINYIEFIMNLLYFTKHVKMNDVKKKYHIYSISTHTNLNDLLKNNCESILSRFNMKSVYFEDEEKLIIIEDKTEATAAAEIAESNDIAKKILSYNHFTMKGDIQAKKDIILALANKIEPQREALNKLNKDIESDLFFMLNNFNLRHNNITSDDKNYKQVVAEMPDNKLEEWYDETYQLILLARLLLDNSERHNKIEGMRKSMKGS